MIWGRYVHGLPFLSCLNAAPTKRVVIKANDDTRQAEIHTSKNI